jgi:hypothetical protein
MVVMAGYTLADEGYERSSSRGWRRTAPPPPPPNQPPQRGARSSTLSGSTDTKSCGCSRLSFLATSARSPPTRDRDVGTFGEGGDGSSNHRPGADASRRQDCPPSHVNATTGGPCRRHVHRDRFVSANRRTITTDRVTVTPPAYTESATNPVSTTWSCGGGRTSGAGDEIILLRPRAGSAASW